MGRTTLIKELCGVEHRGGLLSLLQPNQSDSAEPPLNTQAIFILPVWVYLSVPGNDTQALKGFSGAFCKGWRQIKEHKTDTQTLRCRSKESKLEEHVPPRYPTFAEGKLMQRLL